MTTSSPTSTGWWGEGVLYFRETPYVHARNGRTYRSFDMDRDGFALLAMGFTGSKALRFKLAYIASRASGAEFNRLEAALCGGCDISADGLMSAQAPKGMNI